MFLFEFVFTIFASLEVLLLPTPIMRWLIGSNSKTSQPLLRLNANDEFNIAIFSDLHYGEEEFGWGITQDIKSTRVMNDILDYENPDFVILNGDLITGENTYLANSTKYLDIVVKPLVEHNVSWASTYGNHDSQFNLSREALFQEENKYPLSYTQHSPLGIPGITNYFLPLYAQEKDHNDTPLAILWFFDSRGGAPFQILGPGPNWVDASAAAWFIAQQAVLKATYKKAIPSLIFVHIPPTAFLTLQNNLLPNAGDESSHFPGLNDDVPVANQGQDWPFGLDIPFMQALVNTPSIHSIYSGHDHGNSWCGNWPENVTGVAPGRSAPHLCFCKHTGYGGYGSWNRGSRVLKLGFGGDGMEVESWVRMEDGEVVQRVGLNETYGVDTYPLDNGEN